MERLGLAEWKKMPIVMVETINSTSDSSHFHIAYIYDAVDKLMSAALL
jgi:hypothetical protein